MTDLLLSSGFLAFARHVGFLEAIESLSVGVDAVVGTSSGAVVGALWAAGLRSSEVGARIARAKVGLSLYPQPWKGVLSLGGLVRELERILPPTFAELGRPFAVGVTGPSGHHLLTEGPLAQAVAASCAMPGIFGPIAIGGVPYRDGGARDRIGIAAWRSWRTGRDAVVHHVARTAGVDVAADLTGLIIVRTPRSRGFFPLHDFGAQVAEARRITEEALRASGRA